jgi:hypothetical protein
MRRLYAVTLPCLLLMLVGCGSTPNPRFYALTGRAAGVVLLRAVGGRGAGDDTAAVDRPRSSSP